MFDNYRFTPEEAAAGLAELLAAVRERGQDPLPLFVSSFAKRLAADRRRYRDYGPYWWALKDAMIAGGYNLGSQTDPLVKKAYRGDSEVETLIMADEFRTAYLKANMIYTNQFLLDAASPDFWVLYDADMEFPAA